MYLKSQPFLSLTKNLALLLPALFEIVSITGTVAGLHEGLAVTENENLQMVVGESPLGVSGRMGLVAGDEIKSGLKVYVQAETDDEEITIGKQVYVVEATVNLHRLPDLNLQIFR